MLTGWTLTHIKKILTCEPKGKDECGLLDVMLCSSERAWHSSRNMAAPSSGSKSKPSKKPAGAGSKFSSACRVLLLVCSTLRMEAKCFLKMSDCLWTTWCTTLHKKRCWLQKSKAIYTHTYTRLSL
jgi:hypothetical protein